MSAPSRHARRGLLLGLLLARSAFAELTVIYDTGQTQPIAPLLRPLLANEAQSTESTAQNAAAGALLGPAALSNLLPIRSPGLQVGDRAASQLKPHVLARLAQGNPRPFFLIGSDPVSLGWLATHRETLNALGAVGMLVQAETEDDVRRVAGTARGLSITLGAGSDLAAALGVDRYPVLITRQGLRQ